jgi:RimJ/RimL family protein N-acetyltransferase
MVTPGPVIATARLILRPHRVEDFDDCAAMWADPGVTRHIGGQPSTREQTWSRLLRYAGMWTLLGYGYWAIEDKTTHMFVGELGFANFKRDIDAAYRAYPEMGWALAGAMHGRGYATEAVRAALDWSDANLAASHIMCLIGPENQASVRVATKTGFSEYGGVTYRNAPALVFRRPRPAAPA